MLKYWFPQLTNVSLGSVPCTVTWLWDT